MRGLFSYNGLFVPQDRNVSGHLLVDGINSKLTLSSGILQEILRKIPEAEFTDYHGTFVDGRKASLLDCVATGHTTHSREGNLQTKMEFFPHIIVLGNRYITSSEECVKAVRYHFENVDCLVYDPDTFGRLMPDRADFLKFLETDHEKKITEENNQDSKPLNPRLGERPIVLFFNGIFNIIEFECDLGTVSLSNRASYESGSAAGIGIKNKVITELEFKNLETVKAATQHLFTLHKLFELCLGGPQRYLEIEIILEDADGKDRPFPLYWSGCNEGISGKTKRAHIVDVLLDPVRRRDEFSRVAAGWLNSYESMEDARRHLLSTFGRNSYGIDRIIGAANMFDLLPEDRVPKKTTLNPQAVAAVEECRKTFKALPKCPVRESALSALGRIDTANLRDKIIHRAGVLKSASKRNFPEIELLCKEAVLCRNHYVHGSKASFNYRRNFPVFVFLIDTLEFVFAISDLIDLGWDFDAWRERRRGTMSHDFSAYVINYAENLQRLKAILSDSHSQ